MAAKPIPEGYHSVTPYLIVDDAVKAIEFYKQAFGARELLRMTAPDGQIGHAELKIGDSPIMLAGEYPDRGIRGPRSLGGSPVSIVLYVQDVDARYARAVAAGAREVRPVQDQFYGDRNGMLEDPFGHTWTLATHTEDVAPEELSRRFEAMFRRGGGG